MAGLVSGYIERKNGKVKDTLAALLDVYKDFGDDTRKLHEKYRDMVVKVVELPNGQLELLFENVPQGAVVFLDSGYRIMETQISQMSDAIRDLCLPLANPSGDISADNYAYVKRTGMLDVEPRLRTSEWGGHNLPNDPGGGCSEYGFAKDIAFHDAAVNRTENITGCGPGIMEAPFEGALKAYRAMKILEQRQFIGFTEEGIVRAEAPNELVDHLVIFSDIRKRIEAFIRASHRIRVHPGGVGTLEEIMTFLGVASHEKNDGMDYPFDLVEKSGGTYMKNVVDFIRTCVGDALDPYFKVHIGSSPERYAEHVMNTNRPVTSMWNHDLYFPTELQEDWEASFDNIESINLTRNQSPSRLVINLVRFFSAMVDVTVKKPEIVASWGSQRPQIKGDPKIIRAISELCQRMIYETRIPASFTSLPIIFQGA
jgi:predicted Rossmann-fold nucleotide-binding protein